MEIKNVLVIGLGEIGKAIIDKIPNVYRKLGIDIKHPEVVPYPNVDVIHICYPQHNGAKFLMSVSRYIAEIKPKMVIIHSTISLDVVNVLYGAHLETPIFHCPVRGTHGQIKEDLNKFEIFYGGINEKAQSIEPQKAINDYLYNIFKFMGIHRFDSGKETALAKLLSVVWYGMEIAFVQSIKRVCDLRMINFDQAYTRYFNTDDIWANSIFKDVKIPRPIFYPGVIGGKCVIQDTKLLKREMSQLCDFIIRSNEVEQHNENIKKWRKPKKCPKCETELLGLADFLWFYCPECKKKWGMVELDHAIQRREK